MIPSKDCFKLNPETVSRISASQHIPTVGRVVEELVWNSIYGCSTVINVYVDFVPKIEVKIDDNGEFYLYYYTFFKNNSFHSKGMAFQHLIWSHLWANGMNLAGIPTTWLQIVVLRLLLYDICPKK